MATPAFIPDDQAGQFFSGRPSPAPDFIPDDQADKVFSSAWAPGDVGKDYPLEDEKGPGLVRGLLQRAMKTRIPNIPGMNTLPGVGLLAGRTPEEALDFLPAVTGAAAAVPGLVGGGVGAVPAGMAGAAAGEAARQGIRGAVGLPPATGLIQKWTGQDPSSLGAMATGVLAEGAGQGIASGVGGLVSKLFRTAPAERFAIHDADRVARSIGAEPALSDIVKGTKFEGGARAAELLGESGIAGHAVATNATRKAVEAGFDALEAVSNTLRETPVGATKQLGAQITQEGLEAGYTAAKTAEKAAYDGWRTEFGAQPIEGVGQRLIDAVGDILEVAPRDRWKLLTSLGSRPSQLRIDLPLSGKPSAFKDLMGRVVALNTKSKVTTEEVRLLVSSLREEGRSASGLTKRLYQSVADAADGLLPADASAALEGPKQLTYRLKEVFGKLKGGTGSPVKPALTSQIPEKIAGRVTTGSAGDLMSAALKYGETVGQGTPSRNALVASMLDEALPASGSRTLESLRGVSGHLERQTEALAKTATYSAEAKEAITQAKEIAKLFRESNRPGNVRTALLLAVPRGAFTAAAGFGGGGLYGAAGVEAGLLLLSKAAYSPKSRALLIAAMDAANSGQLSVAARLFQQAGVVSAEHWQSKEEQDKRRQSLGPMIEGRP